MIITGGENVSSIEVEDAVFSHPAVAEVAVIGVPDDKWGEMVTAIVVARRGRAGHRGGDHRPLPRQDRRLQDPQAGRVPRRHWPRTATGKIQKFKLRESFWEDSERQVN